MRAWLLSGFQRIVFGGGVHRVYADVDFHAIPNADRNNHRNADRNRDMDLHAGSDTDITCELPPHGTGGLRPVLKPEPGLRVQPELAM
jgi:hypothetical protein